MDKIKNYLIRIFRLALSHEKQEEIVWKELKKLHADAEWKYGVYEKEKYIETVFEISKNRGEFYYYMIYDGRFHCRVKVLEDYPVELTTELFVLAAHFNNILKDGVVIVNVNNNYVEFHRKTELLIPLLYTGEIHDQMINHYKIAKDIYAAFQRLVIEQEAPAIIIADLLKNNESNGDESK